MKPEMYSVSAQQIPLQFPCFDNVNEVCLSAASVLPMYDQDFLAVAGVCFVN
jgi:hypothetical protein